MTAPARRPQGRLLARNSLLNLLGFGAPMIVALLAVPLLVDGLGADRFGVLAIAWMLLAYLGELGFGSTTTKFTAEAIGADTRHELGQMVWTTTALQAALGLAEGLALALATPWLVESVFNIQPALWAETRLCLYLLAAALPVIGIANAFKGALEAGQRFDLITAVRIPATASNYLLPVAGVILGWSLPAIFGLVLASRVAVLFAYATLAVRSFPDSGWRPGLHRARWREMLGFGGWVAVSSVVSPLIVYLDRFMVGALLSMAAVTYYAAPYELIVRLSIVPMAVVGTLYPAFSQMVGGDALEHARGLAARAMKMVLIVMAPAALLLVGWAHDGLTLWLGETIAREGALALQILGVGVVINAGAQIPYALLQGTGRPDLPARFHLVELPVHVLATWLLVTRFGIPGAALAWTLRVTVDAVLLFTAAHRLDLLRMRDLAAERIPRTFAMIAIAGIAVVMPLGGLFTTAPLRLAVVAGVVVAAMGLIWRFAMGPAERSRIVMLMRPSVAS